LRLPPEVRNQIWSYVLGGHVIDVEETPKPNTKRIIYPHNICNNDSLCTITKLFRDIEAGRRVRTASNENIACALQGRRGRMSFALFFVCRQVYREVKLLPYKENAYFFWNVDLMYSFLTKVRTREQVAAMREIAVVVEVGRMLSLRDVPPHYWDKNKMGDLVQLLKGLRCLDLLVRIPVDHVIRVNDQQGRWKEHRWMSGVLTLKEAGLKEVNIVGNLSRDVMRLKAGDFAEGIDALRKHYQLTDEDVAKYAQGLVNALLGKEVAQ
jgi:hypothetical protein